MDKLNEPSSKLDSATASLGEILLVDDNPDNLRLFSALLRQQGYHIRCATGGGMALRSIQSASPDLILLDIMMPEIDGYEVCRQLKANPLTAAIPVIFLSAADDPSYKRLALAVGGVDYVTKPYRIQEIVSKVQAVLNQPVLGSEISKVKPSKIDSPIP